MPVHVVDDLSASLRERGEHAGLHTLDLCHPLGRVTPFDSEGAAECCAQVCLVEVAGGEAVGLEDGFAVEGSPFAVGALGEVADDDVGVQLRVLGAAGAVLEGGGDEASGVFADHAVSAATGDAGLVLEVAKGGLPRVDVRLADGPSGAFVTEGVQQADALGGGEHQVETRHRRELLLLYSTGVRKRVDPLERDRPRARRPSQSLSGCRMEALRKVRELTVVDDSGEPEVLGAPSRPDAGGLPAPCVVVVKPLGD